MNRQFLLFVRNYADVPKAVYNRNPRNLEQLTIGYRPSGWHLEKPGREYWNKVVIEVGKRNLTASVKHHSGAVPVTASTKEWAIKKHLYSTLDKAAFSNIGRILGRRCLETGITEVYCDLEAKEGGRVEAFLNELEKSGVTLQEPPRYTHPQRSDPERPQRPWEVH